jgi:O-antigen ligase
MIDGQLERVPTSPYLNADRALAYALSISILVCIVPVAFLMLSYHTTVALLLTGVIAAAVMVFFPRVCFYLLMLSLTVSLPYQAGSVSVHPFDLCMALLFGSVVLDYILNVHVEIRPATFDIPFVLLITATVISAVWAHDPHYSVLPLVRIVIIYLAFRLFFMFGLKIGVRRLLQVFIYAVTVLSLLNILIYLVNHGSIRVFGIAGVAYRMYAMVALPMALAFLIWAQTPRGRLQYGVICFIVGFGLIATGSRAPLLGVIAAAGVMLLVLLAGRSYTTTARAIRQVKKILLPLSLLIILLIIFKGSIFAITVERYQHLLASLNEPQGSVAMRLVLGAAAIEAFWTNPLTGIGIGNFKIIEEIVPTVSLAKLWFRVQDMSAHNVILHYLAETGILGVCSLIYLGWRGFKTSLADARKPMTTTDNQAGFALLAAMVVFCTTIFFMEGWMWGQDGYILAFVFGLAAAWHFKHQSTNLQNYKPQFHDMQKGG